MKIPVKVIFLSVAIFLLAAGCGRSAGQPVSRSVNQPSPTPSAIPQTAPAAQAPVKQTPAAAIQKPETLTVYQTVDGSNVNKPGYQVAPSTNAFELLNTTHQVVAKDYGSGMGEFVQTIDGIAADSKHFWQLFVNGKPSNLGASNYILKNGDKIEWKLTAISSSEE